ncbi:MAG: GNAT family N-acetyltransferase [Candidatus Binatia bacterium]
MRSREEVRVVRDDGADAAPAERLQNAIDSFNMDVTGRRDWSPLAVFLRDRNGSLVGGVTGDVWAGWLHVKVLWVDEPLRRQGYGGRLLAEAEAIARERGCVAVHLETFSFQAPDFYRRHGYEEFGRLDGYPEGHAQFYFRKRLTG